jgi:hypothetical protein
MLIAHHHQVQDESLHVLNIAPELLVCSSLSFGILFQEGFSPTRRLCRQMHRVTSGVDAGAGFRLSCLCVPAGSKGDVVRFGDRSLDGTSESLLCAQTVSALPHHDISRT